MRRIVIGLGLALTCVVGTYVWYWVAFGDRAPGAWLNIHPGQTRGEVYSLLHVNPVNESGVYYTGALVGDPTYSVLRGRHRAWIYMVFDDNPLGPALSYEDYLTKGLQVRLLSVSIDYRTEVAFSPFPHRVE
jgi:hypothetical protein